MLGFPRSPHSQHAAQQSTCFTPSWIDEHALSLMPSSLNPTSTCREWLLNIESLTERLTQQCTVFSVTLLGQYANESGAQVATDELALVAHSASQAAQLTIREVLLNGDDRPWVFARSIFPIALTQDALHGLGEQPLGKLLFNDPRFQRQPFTVSLILPDDPFVQHLLQQNIITQTDLQQHLDHHAGIWARRSVFTYLTHHILVNEVFLPGAPAYG